MTGSFGGTSRRRAATLTRVSHEGIAAGLPRRFLRRAPSEADRAESFVRTLYAEHGRALLGAVTRMTGDRELAQDIVQETLLRAWRHSDQLTGREGSVRGWLMTVARNLVVDAARARKARPAEVPPGVHDPAEPIDATEHVANAIVVAQALNTLTRSTVRP